MTMSAISKELAALDAVIEGASALAQEAIARKADLKQGKLASEAFGRVNTAVKVRLESRLNQGRLIEIEAKLVNADAQTARPEIASQTGKAA
jgi:hypothetical protein